MPVPQLVQGAVKKLIDLAHRARRGRRLPTSTKLDTKSQANPGIQRAKIVIYQSGRDKRRNSIQAIFRSANLKKATHGLFKVYSDTLLHYKPTNKDIRSKKAAPLRIPKRMKAVLQFVTAPTADTPGTTLLLHFDDKRYLFGNVAEGTQRACVQRRFGLAKVSDIFLTGTTSWQTAGGLLGVILTVADTLTAQKEEKSKKIPEKKQWTKLSTRSTGGKDSNDKRTLTIHGGENLTHLLATARKFVFRKGTPIEVEEIKEGTTKSRESIQITWEDSNIRVWAMTIPSSMHQRKRSHEEMILDAEASADDVIEKTEDLELETEEQLENRNMQFRRGVVGHMFDSQWRLDSLRETKLADVKLPAAIFIRKPGGGLQEYKGPLPQDDEAVPDIDVLVRKPWPGAAVTHLPPTTPSNTATSYIVKTHAQRGRFLPEEAKRLGVKAGSAFGKLTAGKSVTTEDGKIVTPEMVLGPGRNGNGFAVVELPSPFHVDGLLGREEWKNKEVMDGIDTMVWILGKGVAMDVRITNFMNKHSKLRHLVASPEVSPNRLALESPAIAAIRLHQVDPERFPIPIHNNITESGDTQWTSKQVKVGAVLNLEPKLDYDEKVLVSDLDTAEVIRSTEKDVLMLAKDARNKVYDPAYQTKLDKQQHDLPSKDAEVVTLGTGSALPSKYRNVSATLLRVPGHGNYLFDCGENTLGQLKRVFGIELPQILRDLKVIWISHLHADHHLGTISVIKAWHDETRKAESTRSQKLVIASDSGMIKWLSEYAEVEDYGHGRLYTLSMDELNNHIEFSVQEGLTFGLSSIRACRVSHCLGALAVVFEFPNRLKVAYSGDCRPSHEFARIGKGATLLIHEATFDDELQGDAIAKKHSTTSEALEIGRKMGARRILLTHFSQRYQKIPIMDSEETDQIAIMAFDYMRCRLADFAKLAAYRPALLKLYEEKEEDPDTEPLVVSSVEATLN